MRKLGVNYSAKWGVSFAEFLKIIKDIGFECFFTGVPKAENIPAMAAAAAELGLEWETMHAPFGHINDIWVVGERGDAMLAEMMVAVDRCRVAGVPIVVVHLSSGNNPPPLSEIGLARYTRLVEYAAVSGVKVAFENQRKPDYLAWAFAHFGRMSHVGFCYDCGHEGCFTKDVHFLPLYGDRLLCTHIHDNDCIEDHDLHILPFDGRSDFGRIARQIRETGYKGPLTLEIHAQNSNKYDFMTPQALMERAAMSIKRLRSMVDF